MLIGCFGAKGLANDLGKKGTQSDISFYNHADSGGLFSFVEPLSYPDKISPMLHAAYMSDITLFKVNQDSFNIEFAESIMALDYLKRDKGFFVLDNVDEEQVKEMIKGTCLESYGFLQNNPADILEAVKNFDIEKNNDELITSVDHVFSPKSVGTVILSGIKKGTIKKYDKVKVLPQKKELLVKSIQVNDKEVMEAGPLSRVGLSIKGIEASELERGNLITNTDFKIGKEIEIDFEKNKFYKKEVPKKVMVLVGLQYAEADFENNKLIFSKDLVFHNKEIILCDPSNKVRILGKGISH